MAIRMDEWKSELERVLGRSDDEGLTLRELAHELGLSSRSTYDRLRLLADAGRLAVGRRRTMSLHGHPSWSPVYWIKSEEKETKKQQGRVGRG